MDIKSYVIGLLAASLIRCFMFYEIIDINIGDINKEIQKTQEMLSSAMLEREVNKTVIDALNNTCK